MHPFAIPTAHRLPLVITFNVDDRAVMPEVVQTVSGMVLTFSGQVTESVTNVDRGSGVESSLTVEVSIGSHAQFDEQLRKMLDKYQLRTLAVKREFSVGSHSDRS